MTDRCAPGGNLPSHRLSWADFDALAKGEGDARVTERFRRAERSRRLLLLRALVDEAGKTPDIPGPLASLEDAWELMARAGDKDPAALESILAHPHTGSWAGYTVRLLRHHISGVSPLWVHVGHMHALAAAAAIRAGLEFGISVPVCHGGVMLPTLGFARLGVSGYSVASAQGQQGRVTVSHGAAEISLPNAQEAGAWGWWGLRHLEADTDGQVLAVRLDDLDPYRGLREPVPPRRLSNADAINWGILLDEAWRILVRYLPTAAANLAAGLDTLVPLEPTPPFRSLSASNGEAFGSAHVGRPDDGISLAASLVHEFQHMRLSGLLHLTPLHEDDPRERFYAHWRDDPRPLGGTLHGVYAFFGVAGFWRALVTRGPGSLARRAGFEFALWRTATWRALCSVRDDPALTASGQRFLRGISRTLESWLAERVPADLVRLADLVTADHYAGWRLRHIRPAPDLVNRLASTWLTGRGREPAAVRVGADQPPTPVPDGVWSHGRVSLVRWMLSDHGPWSAETTSPARWQPLDRHAVPDATAADAALIVGSFADAARGYRAELAATPGKPTAWAGLGLALAAAGSTPAARTLMSRPELVRAVDRQIRAAGNQPPPPDELAGWIGRSIR